MASMMADTYLFLIFFLCIATSTADSDPNATAPEMRIGWVSQPDGRGTFDILFSCLFTVFLCTWTSLHLNVPALHETYWQQFRRKCRWMIQTVMAPEFVLGFASGQKVEAQRSVKMFRDLGYKEWTIRHSFYANMGGFHLKPKEYHSFPINAKQLLYLVKKKYVDYPDFSAKDVWDKSKADGFQKLFTCIQTGWFLVQCLGRALQQLPVTTLELTTFGFVLCTLVMYIQWANKPLDVERPTIIRSNYTINQILIEAGDCAKKPYRQTPLDFIDDQSPSWLTEVQPYLKFRRGPPERPLPRFTNDRFPVIGAGLESVLFFIFSMIYCSLHFIGWNFSFPTHIEKVLWRSASITLVVTALIFWMCEIYQDGVRVRRWKRWRARMFPTRGDKDIEIGVSPVVPEKVKFIPVWEFIIVTPVTIIYSMARSYIMIEIFLSQRSLPARAFDTVDWSRYIPHF